MATIPLKCPKCGKSINLDDQKETGTCEYCGSQFPFQEAARKYVAELAGKLKPDEESTGNPVVFTTTTTTINGEPVTDNELSTSLIKTMSKVYGASFKSQGFSTEPIPGYDLPEKTDLAIRLLVLNNQKLVAIKLFRESTGVGLKEAKDVIDRLDSGKSPGNSSIDKISPGKRHDDPAVKVSGCYIATAVYGSYDAPEVRVLRRFRDEVLSKTLPGRAFIRTYYAVSPPIARRLENAGRVNRLARRLLNRIVHRLEKASKI